MAEKYLDKYRITPARLKNWDYGSPGLYFITICSKDRECSLGEINGPDTAGLGEMPQNFDAPQKQNLWSREKTQNLASLQVQLSGIGLIAKQYWIDIPRHFPFVELDEFIIMPNHLHGILFINKPEHDHWQENRFGPQSRNLPSIIRGYKAAVKKYATINGLDFGWQPRYYDRVIRSEVELARIREYIQNNPAKWHQDKNNPEGILM